MKTIPLKYRIDSLIDVGSYLPNLEEAFEQELSKLSKEELCVYLVHNNDLVRKIAKELYDKKS
jgi:hypothetical protein